MIIMTTAAFLKSSVYISRPRENEKWAFSNSSSFRKSVFEELRFRDGLVRTKGLIREIKLRFQIPQA